ncbi:MAG TPA: YsnF/AvaK domain-containing protein [Streptosporangiaceae bacterium]|nr:YsnF/AvaK domain-containing protein [Streptosporangiaceae bacterium]
MTMQAEQLIGSRVIEGNGHVVGTVQQIFTDDKDGTPVWARIRAGTRELFVPLGGSRATEDGLSVPFDTQKIMSSPDVSVERHMSVAQTDELNRHYGVTVPAQGGPPDGDAGRGPAQRNMAQAGQPRPGEAGPDEDIPGGPARGENQRGEARRGEADGRDGHRGADFLIRTEERVDVGTEMRESGRARMHKYVDTEPVERTVHAYHEEYDIERVPISAEEQVRGEIGDAELEIILHEERPVLRKQAVAVERVRIKIRRVEEDRTLRDEIRKERVEIEPNGDGRAPQPAAEGEPRRGRR